MARKKIEQDVFYKSFRYTSKHNLLNEFLNQQHNINQYLLKLIQNSIEYKNYLKNLENEVAYVSSGFFDC